ncbi:MAG: hypothetical protein ACK559_36025, partial [bacterium]
MAPRQPLHHPPAVLRGDARRAAAGTAAAGGPHAADAGRHGDHGSHLADRRDSGQWTGGSLPAVA